MTFFVSEETQSPWMETRTGRFSPLPGNLAVDVCVVGAGVTGATTALLLKRQGHRVALIDALPVLRGETARTTAHLTQVLDQPYRSLIDHLGLATAATAFEAHGVAIDRIERLCGELGAACDFVRVPGYLFCERPEEVPQLDKERDAIASLGAEATLVSETPLPFPVARALRVERQAQIHPGRYLAALLDAVQGDGSFVYDRTRAIGLQEGDPCQVDTDRGVITCGSVVLAAHVPITNRVLLHTKLTPLRSYVIALPTSLPDPLGLFWDTAHPYHYVRTCRVGDEVLLIVGGADHRVGQNENTEASFDALEQWAASRFGPARPRYRWSGQIIEPADGLPYIGRNSLATRVFVATGYSGNGMTGGTLAALMLADEALGKKHAWHDAFAATRVRPFASARAYVKQNADVARHLVVDRFRTEPPEALTSIPLGGGRVVQSEGGPLAVYRADSGHLSACSAVCTHMNCLVAWNTAERSWDCPCHGSRFDAYGEVLSGPATEALERRNLADETTEEAFVPNDALTPTGA